METKFTKAPWFVAGKTGFVNQIEIAPAICTAYGAGEELEANARLIAAAPELFEALRMIAARDAHRGTVLLDVEEMDIVRAALAKATGEQA